MLNITNASELSHSDDSSKDLLPKASPLMRHGPGPRGFGIAIAALGLSAGTFLGSGGIATAEEPRPSENQLAREARPASNAKPVTDYIVFKDVPFGKGQVVTGWKFKDNQQEEPSQQFCYYSEALNRSSEILVWLGYDGRFKRPESPPFTLDVGAAFSNCVWRSVPH
jgi:hypothetical protein